MMYIMLIYMSQLIGLTALARGRELGTLVVIALTTTGK